MSFKKMKVLVVALISCILVMGCSKESEPTAEVFKVSFGEKGSCFKNIPETFQRYFDNEISDGEIHGFWSCAQSAFQVFDEIVKGKSDDTFTPQELNRFMKKWFLKGEPLPDSLVSSIMTIKVAWFGGSQNVLTRQELRQFQVWFSAFDQVMVMLRPHLPVYLSSESNVSRSDLLLAEMKLLSAANMIGSLPLGRGRSIAVKDFENFLTELDNYLSSDVQKSQNSHGSPKSPMKEISDLLPSVMTLKHMMFGTSEDTLAVGDWKNVLNTGAQGFMIFRHASAGIVKSSIDQPAWSQAIAHVVDQVNSIIHPIYERRKDQPIIEAEWKHLFEQIEKSNLISLKSDELMQIYLTLHDLIKAPTTKGNDCYHEDFINLFNDISQWRQVHDKILAGQELNVGNTYEAFLMDLEKKNQELQLDSNAEWLMPAQYSSLDMRSRLHLNWRAALFYKLLFKYGSNNAWTLDQLRPLQKSLSSLFEEKYLLKVFREANLFTLAGGGDDKLSPTEAVQYLSLVLSGMQSSSRIRDFSTDLSVANIQQAVWKNKSSLFSHLPLLLDYLKDEKTWIQTNELLMATVKDQASLVTPWTSWELSQSQIMLLYLEGFMRRFDLDRNQVIDFNEAKVAFKIFAPIVGELVKKIGVGPDELEGFFMFLIKYGDTPFTLYGGEVLYTHWKWNPQSWTSIQADRKTLLSILATLSKL